MKIGVAVENFTSPGNEPDVESLKTYCLKADELGYESIWTWDHLLLGSKNVFPVLDSLTLLSYCAGVTKRINLGSLYLLALRDPLVVAKVISGLNYISGNRLLLAVISGWYKKEFDAVGIDFNKRGKLLVQNLNIIKTLLYNEDINISFDGKKYEHVTIAPRPKQPIKFLMGGYTENVLKRVGKMSDGWLSYYYTPDSFRTSLRIINNEALKAGRNPENFENTNMVPIYIDSDENVAKSKVLEFTNKYMDLPKWSEATVESGIWGSVEKAIEKIEEYKLAGVKRLVLIPAFYRLEQMIIIGEKVLSQFL